MRQKLLRLVEALRKTIRSVESIGLDTVIKESGNTVFLSLAWTRSKKSCVPIIFKVDLTCSKCSNMDNAFLISHVPLVFSTL